MAKLTLAEITADYGSKALFNDNFALIESAIENTLSRDGTTPNTMGADLDMNSNRINNLPDPINNSEPITLGFGESLWGNASTYAAAAAASAAAAAASEAATAADAIATSADAVSTAADAASTAADAIATAADRVQTGLDAAATAADVVSTNADAASTAADVVSTNADVVSTNADAAATAADAISTAADAAATAADVVTVAGIYDSFDDRYLGAKASDPALDNDGNALLTGALYFNTTSSEMRVWSGSAWLASYVPSSNYVAKSGDTMTGALSGITPTDAAHLTRKDYVDTQVSTKVSVAGDTMSGNLSIDKSYPSVQYYGLYPGQGSRWATMVDDSTGGYKIQCYDAAETAIAYTWLFYRTGDVYCPEQVKVGATAPVDASDLTRKDYVDELLAFSPQFTLIAGADDVFPLLEYAQFGFTIDKAYYKTDSGTITAEVAINGTAVTGLSALSLTSTQDNSTATAANTVAVGDKVAITLSSNSSADTVSICLHCTRT
jgi:hypothetical protein